MIYISMIVYAGFSHWQNLTLSHLLICSTFSQKRSWSELHPPLRKPVSSSRFWRGAGEMSQSVNHLICKLKDLIRSQHPWKSWVQWCTFITPALKGEKKQLDSWKSLVRNPSHLVGNSNERPNLKKLTWRGIEEYTWHWPLASMCTHIHTHE